MTTIFLPIIFLPIFGPLVASRKLLALSDRFVLNCRSVRFVSPQTLFVPFAVGTKR